MESISSSVFCVAFLILVAMAVTKRASLTVVVAGAALREGAISESSPIHRFFIGVVDRARGGPHEPLTRGRKGIYVNVSALVGTGRHGQCRDRSPSWRGTGNPHGPWRGRGPESRFRSSRYATRLNMGFQGARR